jgi:hypothetical protein
MNRQIAYFGLTGVIFVGTLAGFLLQHSADTPTIEPVTNAATVPATPTTPDSTPPRVAQPEVAAAGPGAAFESELVNGIWVRKDRKCTMHLEYRQLPDGSIRELHSCIPDNPPEKHPYKSYSSEALLTLAYSDAEAAEILGMRLREQDREMAMSLILRASALSAGDTSPIDNFSDNFPLPSRIDGVPVQETVRVKYVLSVVTKMLGAEVNAEPEWREQVSMAFDNPDVVLQELDAQAWDILDEMQAIELEVTGRSQIVIKGGSRNAQ